MLVADVVAVAVDFDTWKQKSKNELEKFLLN
jgi:hypothetical protein